MAIRATFSEHDDEPVRGLPSALPSGEYVLWQGAPSWRSLALHAYRVKLLALYFALIIFARGAYLISTGGSLLEALRGCVGPAVFSLVCLAIVAGIARLSARSTIYTITTRRVVIRQGIALSSTINLPFKAIESAQILMRNDGTGDITLTVDREQRVSYLWLWPHVRPGFITRPQPSLRSLPNPSYAGEVLGRAYADHTPGTMLGHSHSGSQEASATSSVLGASA
ncbi:MAG: PH domain-containing protein [Gammaproteobacteria bacterium]|nr:PH domain-containing protein [Gammaproteobacteria bacterium]